MIRESQKEDSSKRLPGKEKPQPSLIFVVGHIGPSEDTPCAIHEKDSVLSAIPPVSVSSSVEENLQLQPDLQ